MILQRTKRREAAASIPAATTSGPAFAPLRLAALAGVVAFGLAACDSGATTQIGSNGRDIEVKGGSNHAVSSTPEGHVITVDGLAITVTAEAITVGDGAPQPLDDWQSLEVEVDDDAVSITVDGEELN